MNVCVTGDVQSIALQSGGKSVSSVSVKPGQSIDLDALGYHLGQKMASTDTAFTWTVTNGIGSVDERACSPRQLDGERHAHLLLRKHARIHSSERRMGDPQDASFVSTSRTVSAASPHRKAFARARHRLYLGRTRNRLAQGAVGR